MSLLAQGLPPPQPPGLRGWDFGTAGEKGLAGKKRRNLFNNSGEGGSGREIN